MAEDNDATAREPDATAAAGDHPRRRARAARTVMTRSAAPTPARRARTAARPGTRKKKTGPVHRVAVLSVIAALVGTAAIPAFAAARQNDEKVTLQQVAAADAQSLVVASDDDQKVDVDRDSYAATTPEEIAKKKAEEAAKAAAAQARKQAAAVASVKVDLSMVGPGSGSVRWPLAHISHIGEGYLARGGEHQGVDLVDPCRTPVFAAASGTVNISSEGYYGYGVAVQITSNIGGKSVKTLYAHMTHGSRQVSTGQHVEAGQVIGVVGNTGRSFGCHLHFETAINNSRVDPLAWLRANAG